MSALRPASDSKARTGGVRSFERIAISASSWASQSTALAAKSTFWALARANCSSRKSASPTAMMRPRLGRRSSSDAAASGSVASGSVASAPAASGSASSAPAAGSSSAPSAPSSPPPPPPSLPSALDGSIATASVWIPTSSWVAPIGKLGSAIMPGGRVPPDSVVVHSAVTVGSPSSQVNGAAQPKVALPRSRFVACSSPRNATGQSG